jgi:hypothetical protein
VAPTTRTGRRFGEALGRDVVEACSVRMRRGAWVLGICAGVGAGIGAIFGGAIAAGMGGGVGAAIGIAVAMEVARRAEPPLAWQMALVLTDAGFELHSLSWRGRPAELLLSATYAEIESVDVERGLIALRVRIVLRSAETVEVEANKGGADSGEVPLAVLVERVRSAASEIDPESVRDAS